MSADLADLATHLPNDLDAYWLPFTANRQFKGEPRLLVSAQGMYYRDVTGREILDGCAGLWCVNAGHGRGEIQAAVTAQMARLDFAPPFQMSHPLAFELAARLKHLAPGDLDHVFFTNSGSESVDTALKIALAYHRAQGEGQRTRLIGRERGYHGVGFGGLSVGGIGANRRQFGPLLGGVDFLPHTYDRAQMGFSRGQPAWGAHLADELERLLLLHDPATVAAVIVEPVAGSTGVLVPPRGYLEKLRAITEKYGILLIFDEVITGFGRLGAGFAADYFDIVPDLMTTAKGLTNGCIPMGAVLVRAPVHAALMQGPVGAIELAHGYTYSGHPVACAAALATLDIYRDEDLFARAAASAGYWEAVLHSLRGVRHVVDLRNLGLVAAIELQPRPHAPGARGYELLCAAFAAGILVRVTGDTIALSPPLMIEPAQIDRLFETLRALLQKLE